MVVTGSRLTDVADAYLMDPTVVDRVVVVSALGGAAAGGSVMGWPNGELDPWADWIVGQRFRYIQVNGYYDQPGDVTAAKAADLPANPFGAWMAAKVSDRFPDCDVVRIRSASWRSACRPSSPLWTRGRRHLRGIRPDDRAAACSRRRTAPPGSCPVATARWRRTGSGRCCWIPHTFGR